MIIYLYINDLLLNWNNEAELNEFKSKMKQVFEISDLGPITHFLSMEFVHTSKGLLMRQRKYASDVLNSFNMS